ncbi:Spy/CpxP family protein refolding chaperone [Ramlibacter rhizophilus]|uniref:Periplasmic heavy metal sensor n=1 Tax=Ramlibacter rhizophilus TaxID=1781167 RepID=A0A4Z0BHV6_9BURK|nr:Spy/CpxP family protein refolding chaperone [Ramlibacter rhizophilus]TFY97979.1 hypothetical protein EZ242_16145 [Ramlibacter rhizophilus]
MTSIRTSLVLAAMMAALAGTAQAHAPSAEAGQPQAGQREAHRHGDPAQRQARFTERMSDLKQKLQITSGQESAWNSFVAAMQPKPRGERMDREALASLTTPQRIDQMRVLRQQRMQAMDQRGEAVKAFYAALSEQQQKTFDELSARPLQRGHRGGPGHHGPHRG